MQEQAIILNTRNGIKSASFLVILILFINVNLIASQYRPKWPSPVLQREIFLLNLEDGYFACQVNESTDFLQLFELSRLCDGKPQCFRGSDELHAELKCTDRNQCHPKQPKCTNGVCLDNLCYCDDGFGGKSCTLPDENECKYRPCDVFSYCTNTLGSFYCTCMPGYDGDGFTCHDVNECEDPVLSNYCVENAECCNLPGHFVCKCKEGFEGNGTQSCQDVDECLKPDSCGRGALCTNKLGSFECQCPEGFTGDSRSECWDIDECMMSPCGNGTCHNLPGGYSCTCLPGYIENPKPENGCIDKNECDSSLYKNPCGSGSSCINTEGSYFCQCPRGFTGDPRTACVDIDECESNSCGANTICVNSVGGYSCECKEGHSGDPYLSGGCLDINECGLSDKICAPRNAECVNTQGGYECKCRTGYTGDPFRECVDINECEKNPCGTGAICVNLEGSSPGYQCKCPEKYVARGSAEFGCDKAECETDDNCIGNARCLNSFCYCPPPYLADNDCTCPPNYVSDTYAGCLSREETKISYAECTDKVVCPANTVCYRGLCSRKDSCSTNDNCANDSVCKLVNENVGKQCVDPCDQVQCGPNSYCAAVDHQPSCHCNTSYSGNPNDLIFGCSPKGPPSFMVYCESDSDCDQVSVCKSNFAGAKICTDVCDSTQCGPNAFCRGVNKKAECFCANKHFTGNPYDLKTGCTLPASAHLCANDEDCSIEKSCILTLEGVRNCVDVCKHHECSEGSKCVVRNHRPLCECLTPGYARVSSTGPNGSILSTCEPHLCESDNECKHDEHCILNMQGLQDCAPVCGSEMICGENADCVSVAHRANCICRSGYEGDAMDLIKGCQPVAYPACEGCKAREPRGCTTIDDCGDAQECVDGQCRFLCIRDNECIVGERCLDGFCVPLGTRIYMPPRDQHDGSDRERDRDYRDRYVSPSTVPPSTASDQKIVQPDLKPSSFPHLKTDTSYKKRPAGQPSIVEDRHLNQLPKIEQPGDRVRQPDISRPDLSRHDTNRPHVSRPDSDRTEVSEPTDAFTKPNDVKQPPLSVDDINKIKIPKPVIKPSDQMGPVYEDEPRKESKDKLPPSRADDVNKIKQPTFGDRTTGYKPEYKHPAVDHTTGPRMPTETRPEIGAPVDHDKDQDIYNPPEYKSKPEKSEEGDFGTRTDSKKPDLQRPDLSRPDSSRPDLFRPDQGRPDLSRPDQKRPDLRQPDQDARDSSRPGPSKPDLFGPDKDKPKQGGIDRDRPHLSRPDQERTDFRQPDQGGPELSRPDEKRPDLRQPDQGRPDLSRPDQEARDSSRPSLSEPDLSRPDQSEKDQGRPVLSRPDLKSPDFEQPDQGRPDLSRPDEKRPDLRQPDQKIPDTRQPDQKRPDWRQPDLGKPVLTRPDLKSPELKQPDQGRPDLSRPDQGRPDLSRPDKKRPVLRQPDQKRPDWRQPDQGRPDLSRPDEKRPDLRQPDLKSPDFEQPDQGRPDLSRPDEKRPDLRQPDQKRPDIRQPDQKRPDFEQPDQGRPELSRPDEKRPDLRQPDQKRPDWRQADQGKPVLSRPDLKSPDFEQPDQGRSDLSRPDEKRPVLRQPDQKRPDWRQPDQNVRDQDKQDRNKPDLRQSTGSVDQTIKEYKHSSTKDEDKDQITPVIHKKQPTINDRRPMPSMDHIKEPEIPSVIDKKRPTRPNQTTTDLPDLFYPDRSQPTRPDIGRPDSSRPDLGRPDLGKPDPNFSRPKVPYLTRTTESPYIESKQPFKEDEKPARPGVILPDNKPYISPATRTTESPVDSKIHSTRPGDDKYSPSVDDQTGDEYNPPEYPSSSRKPTIDTPHRTDRPDLMPSKEQKDGNSRPQIKTDHYQPPPVSTRPDLEWPIVADQQPPKKPDKIDQPVSPAEKEGYKPFIPVFPGQPEGRQPITTPESVGVEPSRKTDSSRTPPKYSVSIKPDITRPETYTRAPVVSTSVSTSSSIRWKVDKQTSRPSTSRPSSRPPTSKPIDSSSKDYTTRQPTTYKSSFADKKQEQSTARPTQNVFTEVKPSDQFTEIGTEIKQTDKDKNKQPPVNDNSRPEVREPSDSDYPVSSRVPTVTSSRPNVTTPKQSITIRPDTRKPPSDRTDTRKPTIDQTTSRPSTDRPDIRKPAIDQTTSRPSSIRPAGDKTRPQQPIYADHTTSRPETRKTTIPDQSRITEVKHASKQDFTSRPPAIKTQTSSSADYRSSVQPSQYKQKPIDVNTPSSVSSKDGQPTMPVGERCTNNYCVPYFDEGMLQVPVGNKTAGQPYSDRPFSGRPIATITTTEESIGPYKPSNKSPNVDHPITVESDKSINIQICVDGICRDKIMTCHEDNDCPSDRTCDLESKQCISPCYACGLNSECSAVDHRAVCVCPKNTVGDAFDREVGCFTPETTDPSTERTIPPVSHINVMCQSDGVQVGVKLGGYDGIVYVKGYSQEYECRRSVRSDERDVIDFKVMFGQCGLFHSNGEASFILVVQKHPKLVTYRARAYHIKCLYNTGERVVTLGFNVSMITTSGTIANTGPPPTCSLSICTLDGNEVSSAEIGDDLLLKVNVQPDFIYGGFARSCIAKTMEEEGEFQYEVTDANGCATDPSIFGNWEYDENKKGLVARFNAFKFPSSNNLRFQCNIRICFNNCPTANCDETEAYGRRRRRELEPSDESDQSMTLTNSLGIDTYKEGQLREEIQVQSNAILTFEKREQPSEPFGQQRSEEELDHVCLPKLGLVLSMIITTLLAIVAVAVAISCWLMAYRRKVNHIHRPLSHPFEIPNPCLQTPEPALPVEPMPDYYS